VPSEAPSEGWGAGGDASLLNRFKVLTCTERRRMYQKYQIF